MKYMFDKDKTRYNPTLKFTEFNVIRLVYK